ncbi:MAG: zinc-binding dehydrogenase [Oscillospiraceae bacterium]|nr:zinc-binding dehydrogenase [Oscillospiraceae bacterium]
MKTKAVRLYGKNDLRLEEFQLPEITESEILAKVVSDSLCMSSYKAVSQGSAHKRVPENIAERPVIIGHEFCGEIVAVGERWRHKWRPGMKFAIQPAIHYHGSLDAPGYSFPYLGGDATYVVIPAPFMEEGCLLPYEGDAFFYGSLAEPMSCIVGAFHACYHTAPGSYAHQMGIARGGKLAILGGAGPMGLGLVQYALHCGERPRLIVVADIDSARLKRAEALISPAMAAEKGVALVYANTAALGDPIESLLSLTGATGFDDVFVLAPVRQAAELGDALLGRDGCLNFFAGPTDPGFRAYFNFYNAHYASTHIVGTSGGNTDDMREALFMMEQGQLDPAFMITHIGGLDAAAQATLRLPELPGGKKLIYTNISLPLTAIADFAALGDKDPLFAALDEIVQKNNGLWCAQAERFLLEAL